MEATRGTDVEAWLDAAGLLLRADEARHNLLFGIADTLRRRPERYPAHDLWLVWDEARVVAAALRTPPHNLLVARPADDLAIVALVDAVLAHGDRPPGVTAARPEAETLATVWSDRSGQSWHAVMAQGIYAVDTVITPPPVTGAAREATLTDRGLLLAWVRAFADEAITHRPMTDDQVAASVDQRLPAGVEGFALWEDDGQPVALCGYGGPTPNGIRIGPVFTPPTFRGRGYATALVATVSTARLAEGRRFCFLYADLANPTSNAIYRRIGYERVCESAEIVFSPG